MFCPSILFCSDSLKQNATQRRADHPPSKPWYATSGDCMHANTHVYTHTNTHKYANTHAKHTQAYGSPTIQAVVRHKWRLYARNRFLVRASIYLFYTLANTVFAILYAKVRVVSDVCVQKRDA